MNCPLCSWGAAFAPFWVSESCRGSDSCDSEARVGVSSAEVYAGSEVTLCIITCILWQFIPVWSGSWRTLFQSQGGPSYPLLRSSGVRNGMQITLPQPSPLAGPPSLSAWPPGAQKLAWGLSGKGHWSPTGFICAKAGESLHSCFCKDTAFPKIVKKGNEAGCTFFNKNK